MSNAPWYLKASADEGPSLKHHKAPGKYNSSVDKLDQRFVRGVKAVSQPIPPSPSSPRTREKREGKAYDEFHNLTLVGTSSEEISTWSLYKLWSDDSQDERMFRTTS